MKYKKNKSFDQVNQVRLEFTDKPITARGGIESIIAKYLEKISFCSWVADKISIQEKSGNAKGIYEKVLASFLTVLVGGNRFSHLLLWQHGVEIIKKSFKVDWLPQRLTIRSGNSPNSCSIYLHRWNMGFRKTAFALFLNPLFMTRLNLTLCLIKSNFMVVKRLF